MPSESLHHAEFNTIDFCLPPPNWAVFHILTNFSQLYMMSIQAAAFILRGVKSRSLGVVASVKVSFSIIFRIRSQSSRKWVLSSLYLTYLNVKYLSYL